MIAKNEIVLISKRPWKSEAYTPIYCAEAGGKASKSWALELRGGRKSGFGLHPIKCS